MKQSNAGFTRVLSFAQPLLLNLLDRTLARNEPAHDPRKLSTMLEAMKVYQGLYESTDLILKTAYHICMEAQSAITDRGVRVWVDALAFNPNNYLRLKQIMDSTLAGGSYLNFHGLRSQGGAGLGEDRVFDPTRLKSPYQVEFESDYYNIARKSSCEKTKSSPTTTGIFNGTDIDLHGDVTASGIISQKPSTEMFLLDPDSMLQNLLNSCYRWNSVGRW